MQDTKNPPSSTFFSRLFSGLGRLVPYLSEKKVRLAIGRERDTRMLFGLYRIASEAHTREQAMEELQRELERLLTLKVAFFLPAGNYSQQLDIMFPHSTALEEADRKALAECWSTNSETGAGWHFEPMISTAGKVGVLGVFPRQAIANDHKLSQLLKDIAAQTASILQHIGLKNSMEDSRRHEERENLRSMLLSSVSHDFKTPLAGIIGALSVYRSLGSKLSEQKRDALVETAIDEAHRLDNFITNILDMARLESGAVQMKREWYDAEGMIENVVRRMRPRCRNHLVTVHHSTVGTEVMMDILMTEQVMQNIIDNACKYTAPGTQIEVRCRTEDTKGFICEVRDFGPGIPPENMHAIFDKYTRLHKKDTQVAGTGLGLAIAKAVMEAQGGWISAANHPEGGALFTLCLPQWRISQSNQSNVAEDEANVSSKQAHRCH